MNKLELLTEHIVQKGINFVEHKTKEIPIAAIKIANNKAIIFNKTKFDNRKEALVALYHEYLHCEYDVFYTLNDSLQTRKRREYKIDKLMIQELVPLDSFKKLLKQNLSVYEISEELDVTESTIKTAYKIYSNMEKI